MSRAFVDGDLLLDQLCEDTGGLGAWVRDSSSPRKWWMSCDAHQPVVEATLENLFALALAHNQQQPLRRGHKLRLCREQDPPFGLMFSFSDIYIVVLAFSQPFSRFVVEPRLRRTLPALEKLLGLLPPVDGGRGRPKNEQNLRAVASKPAKK